MEDMNMVNNIDEIEKCCNCGTELTALNISDIEPGVCQTCVKEIIEKLDIIPEDLEFETWSNTYLNLVISGRLPCHQDWDSILLRQKIDPHPIRYDLPKYAKKVLLYDFLKIERKEL
jgi:hypothetical protein